MTPRSYLAKTESILDSSWGRFADIAKHVGDGGTPFPDALPSGAACDFDFVKGLVCRYRVGNLRSVDAVLPGAIQLKSGFSSFMMFMRHGLTEATLTRGIRL